jgi:hypothetical protein
MKKLIGLAALCVTGSLALGPTITAQELADPAVKPQEAATTQTTTEVSTDGITQSTKTTTVTGRVVRYEPGKTIVVMGSDNREVSYPLSTKIIVPGDVRVGREVSLSTEPSQNGPVTVTRITTRSMTPEGNIKTETQTSTSDANGNQTSMNVTNITGTVSAFEPGKSVTLVLPDKKTVLYTMDSSSAVPSDLTVGKTYTVQTTRTTTGKPLLVKKITSTQTTTKTTTVQ